MIQTRKKSSKKKTKKGGATTVSCKDLITLEEFVSYIDKHPPDLLLSTIKTRKEIYNARAIEFKKTKYSTDATIQTNKQFSFVVSNNDGEYINKIYEMIHHFVGNKYIDGIMKIILSEKKDTEILSAIKEVYGKEKNIKPSSYKYNMSILADCIHRFIDIKNSIPKILDIGCGDGKKIKLVSDMIECDIFGADIPQWGNYKKERNIGIEYKIITHNPYHVDYKNSFFDCITLLSVLHHVSSIIDVIEECKRMLKKTGIIVILEHDVWNDKDIAIIDIQHKLFQYLNNEKHPSSINCYYNVIEWDIIFDRCGMKPVHRTYFGYNVNSKIKYDMQYITVYKLK